MNAHITTNVLLAIIAASLVVIAAERKGNSFIATASAQTSVSPTHIYGCHLPSPGSSCEYIAVRVDGVGRVIQSAER